VNSDTTKRRPFNFLFAILFLQCALYVTVIFNIPVARQVIGFAYFTFVPGFVFVKLMKMDKLGVVTSLFFSVGFSVAFLMFSGLLINEVFTLFDILQPLSLAPLLVCLNALILLGSILVYLRGEGDSFFRLEAFCLPSKSSLLFFALPIMSVIGVMWVNVFANNLVLLFTLISIALLFAVAVISKWVLPARSYPVAVLMLSIAILYSSSLISNYIVSFGSDVPSEYYAFRATQLSAHWVPTNPIPTNVVYGNYHAMLSVTILPTIYSTLLHLDPTWTFRMLFPLIFSFVPLGLYLTWKEYMGEKGAFTSAFLFMAQSTFFTEMLGLNRQIIAELFFALLLLVILNKKLGYLNKSLCFAIFGVALVVSHYSTAALFLLFIFAALFFSFALKHPGRNITIGMVALFFVAMFSWYIYTSNSSVFASFLAAGNYLKDQLGYFFQPSSRGQTVLLGLGIEAQIAPSIWNTLSRAFAYLTEGLIAVGFVGLITRRMKNRQFGDPYFAFIFTAMALLVALIAVPGLANTLNMTRFYTILLFFLAPLSVVGAQSIVKVVSRKERQLLVSLLLLIVLVPYFLFQTGVVYEIAKSDSYSIPLSEYRMSPLRSYYDLGYIDAYSAFGAEWLATNVNLNSTIFSDIPSESFVLPIYGTRLGTQVFTNGITVQNGGVIYLSTLNVVYGKIVGQTYTWNSTNFAPVFYSLSLVYNNGGSEVYQNTG
jgi:uncharacterized membrane protein